jgi:hypothetical protein
MPTSDEVDADLKIAVAIYRGDEDRAHLMRVASAIERTPGQAASAIRGLAALLRAAAARAAAAQGYEDDLDLIQELASELSGASFELDMSPAAPLGDDMTGGPAD